MTVVKERAEVPAQDKLQAAGNAAERQMAFYLKRMFGDREDVLVFNDLRLVDGDDVAQIDHLILHRSGGIIIESKSVTQKVRVNQRGEWARLWDKQWRGMRSPIIQAQQQADFVRGFLQRRKSDLRKKLMGLVQGGFGAFDLAVLVAVSDSGIIERASPDLAPEAMKADQVSLAANAIIEQQRKASSLTATLFAKDDDARISLDPDEFARVADLLLASHVERPAPEPVAPPEAPPEPAPEPEHVCAVAACKHCRSDALEIRHGRFGYYWKCTVCDGNTAIDKTAPDGSEGRVRKQGRDFFLTYGNGQEIHFHTNAETAPEDAVGP